jgi:lysozyme
MKNLLLPFLIVLALTSCTTEDKTTEPASICSDRIIGIDISHHQGNIDWSEVSTWNDHPIQFIYIKATEGATGNKSQDPKHKENIGGAKRHGFLVGSYHYFRTTSEPRDQFENFMKVIDKNEQDLVPMVDVEEMEKWNSKTFHKNLKLFLKLIEDEFGKKPIIYAVNSFYNHHLSNKYDEYEFLIGRHGENSPNMRDEKQWYAWQFSETGKVKGIPKLVDIDMLSEDASLQTILLNKQ